jgi:hypothetical protein
MHPAAHASGVAEHDCSLAGGHPTPPANPPAAAAQAQAANAKKKTDDNQLVCKSEQVVGSRLPVKRCRTAAQAAAEKQNAREELDRVQGNLEH